MNDKSMFFFTITLIYERLINSINHLNFDTLKKIFITRDFKSFAKYYDLFFLISIICNWSMMSKNDSIIKRI